MARVRLASSIVLGLIKSTSNSRATAIVAESTITGFPKTRSANSLLEATVNGFPKTRYTGAVIESAVNNQRNLRSGLLVVETLIAILEARMSTRVFPALRGLSYGVTKRPVFNNKVAPHVSGKETATAYWANPRWEYTVHYDWLPDRAAGTTDLKNILGFFMQARGNFDTWLFQDPDDNTITGGTLATLDGATTGTVFSRNMGGFLEPVGQVRQDTPINVYVLVSQTASIPAAGPFTITPAHASEFFLDFGVTKAGTAMTKVASAPTTGQYSVNLTTGVYTFAAADASAAVIITYQYLAAPASYVITLPNVLNFNIAPVAGAVVSADFQYYFVCRFVDSYTEVTKFSNQLWELQKLNFKSVLL